LKIQIKDLIPFLARHLKYRQYLQIQKLKLKIHIQYLQQILKMHSQYLQKKPKIEIKDLISSLVRHLKYRQYLQKKHTNSFKTKITSSKTRIQNF
jgi:hypothetical protein